MSAALAQGRPGRRSVTLELARSSGHELSLLLDLNDQRLSAILRHVRRRHAKGSPPPIRRMLAFAVNDLENCRIDVHRQYDGSLEIGLWLGSAWFDVSGPEAEKILATFPGLHRVERSEDEEGDR